VVSSSSSRRQFAEVVVAFVPLACRHLSGFDSYAAPSDQDHEVKLWRSRLAEPPSVSEKPPPASRESALCEKLRQPVRSRIGVAEITALTPPRERKGNGMMRVFKRSLIALMPAVLAAFALTVAAWAAPDGTTSSVGVTSPSLLALVGNDDLFSVADLSTVLDPTATTPTRHYGPYASSSSDSGRCGNDWANDTFDRDFTVRSNGDGTYSVVEQFKNGSFVTIAGLSPGACETYDDHGHTIGNGTTGSMHGYFIVSNVGPPTSNSPYCDAASNTNDGCTTATFINTHFTPCYPATCTVTTFFAHYAAGDQSLLFHEWKDASADRGGDDGDIASG
jgi:hypothetical protein